MKKIKLISILAATSLLITGCGLDAMPELSSDESDMISEYAAGLLLKYSSNYDYKIVDDIEIASYVDENDEPDEPENVETEFSAETESTTEAETYDSEDEGDTGQTQANQEEIVADNVLPSDTDIAQLLGTSDISIKYVSYEICDSYPKDTSGFNVSASQGDKLLVIHFNIENNTGGQYSCNLFDYDLKAKISINESRSMNGLSTMLPNDMLSYMDTLSAGSKTDVVVLAQVSEVSAQNLSSLSIRISTGNDSIDLKIE